MNALKVGEYVFQKERGICYVSDKVKQSMAPGFPEQTYFVLRPLVDENTKIFVAENKEYSNLREPMSRKKALDLIQNISKVKPLKAPKDKNERERIYKEAIDANDPTKLLMIIKNLNINNAQREEEGRKITTMDERYGRVVQRTFNSEIAFIFDVDLERVEELMNLLLNSRKKIDLKEYGIKANGTHAVSAIEIQCLAEKKEAAKKKQAEKKAAAKTTKTVKKPASSKNTTKKK